MLHINFSGSKQYSYKPVKEIVKSGGYKTVFEPFGGSAVLSVNLKHEGIIESAYINDFDGLFDDLPQFIEYKEALVKACIKAGIQKRKTGSFPKIEMDGKVYPVRESGLTGKERKILQFYAAQIPDRYYRLFGFDNTFTHSAVGSHDRVKLSDFTYFKTGSGTGAYRKYLKAAQALNRDRLDYRAFLVKHSDKYGRDSLIIADPPYVSTAQGQYKTQFTEAQTLELIQALDRSGSDYIFFNHGIERVSGWFKRLGIKPTILTETGNSASSANRKRLDVMAYVKKS